MGRAGWTTANLGAHRVPDAPTLPAELLLLLTHRCRYCCRFQAVLQAQGPQASFKVVENNDFKQVPHITLTFRPGSDAAVKQFLAFRLTELKSDCSQLSSELERTQVRLEGLAGQVLIEPGAGSGHAGTGSMPTMLPEPKCLLGHVDGAQHPAEQPHGGQAAAVPDQGAA